MVSLIKTLFLDIGCASCPKVARVVHPWATLVIHGRVFSIEMVPQTTSNCPKNFDFWKIVQNIHSEIFDPIRCPFMGFAWCWSDIIWEFFWLNF